jgi:flagellar assembly protein FliH
MSERPNGPASGTTVLRDIAVHGQVALARPRPPLARPAANEPVRPAAPTVAPAPAISPLSSIATPPAARGDPEAQRQGFEDGLAQGRAKAAEEARDAASRTDQALQKKLQDLEAQAQKQMQDHQQKDQAALQSRLQRIDALLSALPAQVRTRIDAAEDDLLALCFESVCRVLGSHAATAEGIRAQVAHAREGLHSRALVAVHLHPDDLATLRGAAGTSPDIGNDGVQWIADPAVALGGCILQSPQGGLDARLETQLRTLAQLLAQSRASARAAPTSTPQER